jgi:hypothetical protein
MWSPMVPLKTAMRRFIHRHLIRPDQTPLRPARLRYFDFKHILELKKQDGGVHGLASFGFLGAQSRHRAPAGSVFWAFGALSSLGALDDRNSFLNLTTEPVNTSAAFIRRMNTFDRTHKMQLVWDMSTFQGDRARQNPVY